MSAMKELEILLAGAGLAIVIMVALELLNLRFQKLERRGRGLKNLAPPDRNPQAPWPVVEYKPGEMLEPIAPPADPAMADGIAFPRWQTLGPTTTYMPFARASTVALLEQFTDPVVLQCIGLECLGAYSLEDLTRGLHVRHLEPDQRRKLKEAIELGIDPECLANIVDHVAFHDARRVWLEKNTAAVAFLSGDVEQISRWVAPDAVPFSLDEHAWPLPYSPSDACLASRALDAARNILEAAAGNAAGLDHRFEVQRIRNDLKARGNELKDVARKSRGRNKHGDVSGKGNVLSNGQATGARP